MDCGLCLHDLLIFRGPSILLSTFEILSTGRLHTKWLLLDTEAKLLLSFQTKNLPVTEVATSEWATHAKKAFPPLLLKHLLLQSGYKPRLTVALGKEVNGNKESYW